MIYYSRNFLLLGSYHFCRAILGPFRGGKSALWVYERVTFVPFIKMVHERARLWTAERSLSVRNIV